MNMIKPAVAGGRRGAGFHNTFAVLNKDVRVTAVCDLSQEVIAEWRKRHPGER